MICAALGFAIGAFSATYLKDFMDVHVKSNNVFVELLKVYGLILIFFVGFLIHIVIHETGHLIFGLMTGYSFVSFRIGSFTLIKENNKLKHKKFNIPGTAGQCLMMPSDLKDGKFPFVIYNFGGVIMNLVVSIAGILVVIFVKRVVFPFDAVLILSSFGLMEYSWHLDNMNFESARQCIGSFIPHMDSIMTLLKNEINCERIFLELVGTCDRVFVDDLYDKKLEKYIKAAKFMIGKKRFLMAYEGFYNEDKNKALKYYEETKQLAKKYPVKGDAEMELMITDWIKEKLNI